MKAIKGARSVVGGCRPGRIGRGVLGCGVLGGGPGGRTQTNGLGADVVIECAGIPSLLQTAVEFARSGGVVSLLSYLAEPATVNAARWLTKEVTVVASNAFTHDDFRRSMTFLADGRVKAQPLHTRTVRLDHLGEALQSLAAGGSDDIKVLVDPRRTARHGEPTAAVRSRG